MSSPAPRAQSARFVPVISALLIVIGPARALAADGPEDAPDSAVGEVVVNSDRAKSDLEIKRSAPQIVDAIGAADIQKLPNTTIAQALMHITGVSVTANNDNERGRNVAMDPAIRGLDSKYNNVMVDGLPIATANFTGTGVSSRAAPLDVLPASLVRSIEVFKTYSPDRDPQSIGGGIELATRSAFDNGGAPFLQVTGRAGYNSQNSQPVSQNPVNYNADVVFSNVFGADRQLGLVISADYQRTADDTYDNATTDSGFYNFYNASGKQVANPALSNGFAVPQQSKAWIIEETDRKADLTAKLEYQPSARLHTFLTLGYYYDGNDSTRNETILTPGGVLTNQTATTGSYSAGDVEVGGQYSPLHRTTYNAQTGGTYSLTDEDVIDVRAGESHSAWRQPQNMVKFINQTTNSPTTGSKTTTSPNNAFNYVLYGNYSIFAMNPAVFSNPQNYGGDYWRYRDRNIDTGIDAFRLDYSHNAAADSLGFGFKAGAELQRTRNSLQFLTPEFDPNTTGAVTLAPFLVPTSFNVPNYSNLPFMLINVNAAFAFLQANPSLFHNTNQNIANNGSNFNLREDVGDGYGMFVFNTSTLHILAGLRSDSAHVYVTGEQQIPNPPGVVSSGLAGTPYPAFRPITVESDYLKALPAVSIDYAPVATTQLRAAVSKTVGRPDYSDYSPSSGVSQDPGTGIVTITQGNPNLKPRVSTNYDLGADWYFSPRSLVSAAIFYKQIADEIFSITTNGTTVFNGAVAPAVTTEPVNASSSHLKGIELQVVQADYGELSRWLAGFVTNLNYTLLRGSAVVPAPSGGVRTIDGLINQPSYIANAILGYDLDRFFGALSYNRTGTSLRQLNASAYWQDVYWSPHEQVDLKAGFRPLRELELTASIENITNQTVKSVTGPDKNLLKDRSYVGRTLWFGFVLRPGL
jgi:iron complex outermembrane receptor protein